MAFPPFKRIVINTGNPQIDKAFNMIQDNIKQVLDALNQQSQLSTVKLMNVSLNQGLNIVPHKLGRNLVGWAVFGVTAQVDLWDSQASAALPAANLSLNASAPCTVNLEVW